MPLRYPMHVYERLVERYAPKIKIKDAKDNQFEVPDPMTIWAGPFFEGLQWLGVLPDDRMKIKSFFTEVADKSLAHGGHGKYSFTFYRSRGDSTLWDGDRPAEPSNGWADGLQIINMWNIHGDRFEPGEIKGPSPGGQGTGDPFWGTQGMAGEDIYADWNPDILVDGRYGLHYLRRGDKITLTFPVPRRNLPVVERTFILRPPNEGPCVIPSADDTGGEVI